MVQVLRPPIECQVRCTSSHSAAVSLPRQIWSRTTGSKISAPPPVIEPSPASRKLSSVSPIGILNTRWAKCRTSIAVNAFMCSSGSRARNRRKRSRYQSFFKLGCNPPTMCTSVTPRGSASVTACTISSIAYSNAWASRFLAANAQNWQDKMQIFE